MVCIKNSYLWCLRESLRSQHYFRYHDWEDRNGARFIFTSIGPCLNVLLFIFRSSRLSKIRCWSSNKSEGRTWPCSSGESFTLKVHLLLQPWGISIVRALFRNASLLSCTWKSEPGFNFYVGRNASLPSCSRTILRTTLDSEHGHRSKLDSITQILPPKHASPSDGGALYKAGNPISIPQLNLCRFFIFHLCFGNIGIGWYNLCLLNLWLRFFQFLRNWLGDLPLNQNHQIQKNSPSNSDHGLAQSARGADKGNPVEVWAQVDGCMGFIEDGHVMHIGNGQKGSSWEMSGGGGGLDQNCYFGFLWVN